jgi:hypothetical protein
MIILTSDLLTTLMTFLPVILLVLLVIIVIIAIPLRRKQGHKPAKERKQ